MSRTQFLWALLAFALFTSYYTYAGLFDRVSEGDQTNIGLFMLAGSNPDLFIKDYAYGDRSFYQFYTPVFVSLIGYLTSVTGSFDTAHVSLIPVIMLVYLTGMFYLVYAVTRSSLISAIIAIVSALMRWSISGEYWGVAGLRMVQPRSLFLALAPLFFLLLFAWVSDKSWWKLPFLGLLVGLASNLHPVSGMIFLQLMIFLIILIQGLHRDTLRVVTFSGVAACVGALPILLSFSQTAQQGADLAVSFETFYEVMHRRLITLFPFRSDSLTFFGNPMSAGAQETIFWLYVVALAIWGVYFAYVRLRAVVGISANTFYGSLFAIHLPLVILITGDRQDANTLIVIAFVYSIHWIFRSTPDRIDRLGVLLIVFTCLFSFVASAVLDYIWSYFEFWQLTSLVGEQARSARFVYLPLYLFAARFMQLALLQIPDEKKAYLFIASLAGSLAFGPRRMAWTTLIGIAILLWPSLASLGARHRWVRDALEALVVGIAVRIGLLLLGVEVGSADWAAYYIVGATYLFRWGLQNPSYRTKLVIGTPIVAILVYIGSQSLGIYRFPTLMIVRDVAAAPGQLWARISPLDLQKLPPRTEDALELYEWARMKTESNSLFFTNSLEFRFRAQRSITHCWKDLGIAYYKRSRLVEFYDRFKKLDAAYKNPDLLVQYAQEYRVDYIIIDPAQSLSLDLPVVFRNSSYTVYRFLA